MRRNIKANRIPADQRSAHETVLDDQTVDSRIARAATGVAANICIRSVAVLDNVNFVLNLLLLLWRGLRMYGAVLIRTLWRSVVLRRSGLAILISITRCRTSLRRLAHVVLTCVILRFVARGNQLHNPVLRCFMAASLPAGGNLRRWHCKSLSSI